MVRWRSYRAESEPCQSGSIRAAVSEPHPVTSFASHRRLVAGYVFFAPRCAGSRSSLVLRVAAAPGGCASRSGYFQLGCQIDPAAPLQGEQVDVDSKIIARNTLG
jgi:hypothetical protein